MPSVRIATGHLVAMLTDLAHTAADPAVGGATAGILLHCARGYSGTEPGQTDLLVGTSTDGHIVGHTHTACSGQVEPMVWPIADARAVIAVLKPLAKIADHGVEISLADDTTVTVAEDPDLFGEGLSISFTGYAVDEYPTAGIRGLLTEIRMAPASSADGEAPAKLAARTDFVSASLAPFLKIASRRNELLRVYRYHQALPVSIQIGAQYRGIVRPWLWRDDSQGAGISPDGDVYPLELAATGDGVR